MSERIYVVTFPNEARAVYDEPREGAVEYERVKEKKMTDETRIDPIAEIDMRDPAHFQKAIDLALAATDPDAWGETKTEWLHELAGQSKLLWTAFKKDLGEAESCVIVAITGNGPTSEANAEFFCSARKIVLGLVSEVDRLKTLIRGYEDAKSAEVSR